MAKLKIKEVATARGIKQSHLQIMAPVTPPLLSRYWHNKINTVDLTELEKIAKALGVSPGDLIISDEEFSRIEQQSVALDEDAMQPLLCGALAS